MWRKLTLLYCTSLHTGYKRTTMMPAVTPPFEVVDDDSRVVTAAPACDLESQPEPIEAAQAKIDNTKKRKQKYDIFDSNVKLLELEPCWFLDENLARDPKRRATEVFKLKMMQIDHFYSLGRTEECLSMATSLINSGLYKKGILRTAQSVAVRCLVRLERYSESIPLLRELSKKNHDLESWRLFIISLREERLAQECLHMHCKWVSAWSRSAEGWFEFAESLVRFSHRSAALLVLKKCRMLSQEVVEAGSAKFSLALHKSLLEKVDDRMNTLVQNGISSDGVTVEQWCTMLHEAHHKEAGTLFLAQLTQFLPASQQPEPIQDDSVPIVNL